MQFRFLKTCGVEGVTYNDGDVVDAGTIPQGSHQSLIRLSMAEVIPDTEPAAAAAVAGEATDQSVADTQTGGIQSSGKKVKTP